MSSSARDPIMRHFLVLNPHPTIRLHLYFDHAAIFDLPDYEVSHLSDEERRRCIVYRIEIPPLKYCQFIDSYVTL